MEYYKICLTGGLEAAGTSIYIWNNCCSWCCKYNEYYQLEQLQVTAADVQVVLQWQWLLQRLIANDY